MNNHLRKTKTLSSFIAAKNQNLCQLQVDSLDLYAHEQIEKGRFLNFVKYWGASDKRNADRYDYDALIMLFGFLKIIENKYKVQVNLTVIFTDSHALLNGYSPDSYEGYFKDIGRVLNNFNYSHLRMSEVLIPYLKHENMNDFNDLLRSIIVTVSQYKIPLYLHDRNSFEHLTKSASKYSNRYTKNYLFDDSKFDTAEQAAYAYIKLNQIEKEYIEKKFSNHIFLTYTSEDEKEFIAPDLLTMQLYSYRKGTIGRPWFSSNIPELVK